jgi:hypothetical protein
MMAHWVPAEIVRFVSRSWKYLLFCEMARLSYPAMFLGHLAVGFASKRVAPLGSLGPLMAAPIFLDLVWPIFVLFGIERVRIDPGNTAFTPLAFDSYPWSHSLVMSVGWAIVCAACYFVFTRYLAGAVVIAAGVVSHWVLDVVSHRPDMPIYPGDASPMLGLGLWNSIPATIAVETSMFAAGVTLYVTMTRPKDGIGRWSLAAFVGLLTVIYIANILGPPPPNGTAVAATALALWLFPAWSWWFDAHRSLAG